MTSESKNNNFFEEYKLYFEFYTNLKNKRFEINKFYFTILSSLAIGYSFILTKNIFLENLFYINFLFLMIGILICLSWASTIKSTFKQIRESEKFLKNIEKNLVIKDFIVLTEEKSDYKNKMYDLDIKIAMLLWFTLFATLISITSKTFITNSWGSIGGIICIIYIAVVVLKIMRDLELD